MRTYLISLAVAAGSYISVCLPAFSIECYTPYRRSVGVEVFGEKQDLYKIVEYEFQKDGNDPRKITSQKVLYNAASESRESFGGNASKKPLQCGNVRYLGSAIAVAVGWQADLLHLYNIDYDINNKATKIYPLHFYARDYAIHSFIEADNSIRVVYGRKQDVNFRFCFRDGGWWQAAGPVRKGRTPLPCTIPSGHARPIIQL